MSSGMGMRGTVGRCYGFFQDLQFCTAELNAKKDDMTMEEIGAGLKACHIHREDYFECLHGQKTFGRAADIARAEKKLADGGHH
mmetsp:Transcript_8200/g.15888  ORF Transcript_8200/g.15888 Transcript_8200/m.15888 type:complete len:84 (+) Transcript_8200:96-347(+)|eukprot:scaffold586_cov155-Amphora_coffeaeformis.AAC.20